MNVPAAAGLRSVRLDAHARRHVLLIAKELATNAARHSGATAVEVNLLVEDGRIVLVLADNGAGSIWRPVGPAGMA
jgi:signal transduction histidine kinase